MPASSTLVGMTEHDNVIPFPSHRRQGPSSSAPSSRASPAELLELIGSVSALSGLGEQPEPRLLARRACPATYTLRIDLDDASPPIWRRIEIASDITLDRVHEVVQAAMGWTDSHLHAFTMGPDRAERRIQPFLTAWDVVEGEDTGIPEADVHLDEVLGEVDHRLFYEYDFGDGWGHTLKLERITETEGVPAARCVGGRRACPPEDVGGIGRYNALVATPSGGEQADEWMRETIAWLPADFDPAAFDSTAADAMMGVEGRSAGEPGGTGGDLRFSDPALLDLARSMSPRARRVLGELTEPAWQLRHELTGPEIDAAVRPLAILLDVVGEDGAELTGAGYLKPDVVVRLGAETGIGEWWIGKVNREDHTPPIRQLRSAAQGLGLVRKHKGRLVLTPAGRRVRGNPASLWAHLVVTLPLGRRREQRHAGVLALLCTAGRATEPTFDQYAGGLLAEAGWGVRGEELSSRHAFEWARPTWEVLRCLRGDVPYRSPAPAQLAVLSRLALDPGV